MKKLSWISRLGIFFFLFVVSASQAFAVSGKAPSPSAIPTPTITPEPIKYVLPYPGLLPTHPLYFIKTLRDKIIEMLITDTLSKAEFYILQADKKLNMGVVLYDSGKKQEAGAAFTESLASRAQAITLLESHVKSGGMVPGHLIEKLFLSLDKHVEVTSSIGKIDDAVRALRDRAEQSLRRIP